jgi:glycosyltransferase involved in cell wall biosynthesis
MKASGAFGLAGVAWRVLRGEGVRAARDRAWDRWLEVRRRRSFGPATAAPPGFRASVLNVAAGPPAPRLGGVQAQLLCRLAAEAERRAVALLHPEPGGGYRLELQDGRRRHALAIPGGPLAAVGLADPAFEAAVHQAAEAVGSRALVVEGLAGLPLGSLLRLRQDGLRLLLALHDFSAFCVRPHLLESTEPPRFCAYSRDAQRCLRCLHQDWPEVAVGFQEERRAVAQELLAGADTLIFPSEFLRRAYLDLFPALTTASAPARVIPPSSDGRRRTAGRDRVLSPVHVAFLGGAQPHKGALFFDETLVALAGAGEGLRFSVYGGGGDWRLLARWRRFPSSRVRVRGYYRYGSLPSLLLGDRVDLALLLSIVPESYSLALDECSSAGVPVIARALGALAERVPACGGLLLPAEAAAPDLARLLGALSRGEVPLPAPLPCPTLSSGDVAAAWLALYSALGLV